MDVAGESVCFGQNDFVNGVDFDGKLGHLVCFVHYAEGEQRRDVPALQKVHGC